MVVFIGSSKESLSTAKEIALIIENDGHKPWMWDDPGTFIAGYYTVETLEKIALEADAAVFVFAEDDKIWYNNQEMSSVRDNVLIEAGLFCGALTGKKVAICQIGNPKIASDFFGMSYIDWNLPRRAEQELTAWLSKISVSNRHMSDDILLTNFNDAFNKVLSAQAVYNSLKIFALSTNRTVRFIEGSGVHIKNVQLLLREYKKKDNYYNAEMKGLIDSSIKLWRNMQKTGLIGELELYRFDFHPIDGFYIFDDKYLIVGNLHFDLELQTFNFDQDALVIKNTGRCTLSMIEWYDKQFEQIKENFVMTKSI